VADSYSLFIDGEWITNTETVANINPSDTDDVIGHYAQANADQVAQAIAAAERALPQWGSSPLETRFQVLMAIGDELIERSGELGELLAREEGKTRAEGVGEVYRSGQFFHYFAAEVHRQIDDRAESVRPGIEIDTRREPVGIVGIISPWNFPMATAVWKIAPALAFGNAVIFKPANLVPASAWALTEIISRQTALPPGTFNLLMGSGSQVGNPLINSDRIHAVSFTGSLPVGRQVAAATAANLVKCQLEMGSKNALIVAADADLDVAAMRPLSVRIAAPAKSAPPPRVLLSTPVFMTPLSTNCWKNSRRPAWATPSKRTSTWALLRRRNNLRRIYTGYRKAAKKAPSCCSAVNGSNSTSRAFICPLPCLLIPTMTWRLIERSCSRPSPV